MKLATYQDGSRDGQLIVVSRDLASAHYATATATRLQQVLEDWNFLAPQLEDLSVALNQGRARHAFAFEPARCMAPLPRAYLRVRSSAYPSHRDFARQAGGHHCDSEATPGPRLRDAAGTPFLGPLQDVALAPDAADIDFAAGLAAITGDIAAGADSARALDGIRLLTIASEIVLRPADGEDGAFGGHAAVAFAPVAVTPDELGGAWSGGRLNLVLQSSCNGRKVGMCDAGQDMDFSFGDLLCALARRAAVPAGSVVGTGPVSNRSSGGPGAEAGSARGSSGIAEKRWIETLRDGAPHTPFLAPGDAVRIDMKGPDGRSMFGAIEHSITAAAAHH